MMIQFRIVSLTKIIENGSEVELMEKTRTTFRIKDTKYNGKIRYCIHDNLTGKDIYCDKGKLTETMWKLLDEESVKK